MLFKQIHLASKDLNKELNEYNILPWLVYGIFFVILSVVFTIKYICKLFKQVFRTTTINTKEGKK